MSEQLKLSQKYSQTWREKDGRLIHDADCWFWNLKICTCGLIHRLNMEGGQPEWFGEEWGKHEHRLARLRGLIGGDSEEPTQERAE